MGAAKATAKSAAKRARKPQLSAPSSKPEMASEDVDCLHIMEECMKFFFRRAIEASDEKAAKICATSRPRA